MSHPTGRRRFLLWATLLAALAGGAALSAHLAPDGEQPRVASPEPTLTPTPSPVAEAGATTSRIDIFPLPAGGLSQMALVPAGYFAMGSSMEVGNDDEHPIHWVYLEGYWIDRTEVTNREYAACIADGGCNPDHEEISFSRPDYATNLAFSNHPVLYVSWDEAQAFCAWAGKRLPTEAEWEKAARGVDGWAYPWGNQPQPDRANSEGWLGDATTVGSFPAGASPYGALDMAGNVAEWVADWYDPDYYARSPDRNPAGPEDGTARVVRGGSWAFYEADIRAALRRPLAPETRNEATGFRCAKSVP